MAGGTWNAHGPRFCRGRTEAKDDSMCGRVGTGSVAAALPFLPFLPLGDTAATVSPESTGMNAAGICTAKVATSLDSFRTYL